MEFGNPIPYDIRITGAHNNGFIVDVGCFRGVFTDKKVMLAAIEDYINDPKKMEQQYNDSNANRNVTAGEPAAGEALNRRSDGPMEDCGCETVEPDQARVGYIDGGADRR